MWARPNMLSLRMITVHYFGFGFGDAPRGTLFVLLKMPSESTLLHFTGLSCRNSAYSWNKTVQNSKLPTLPNGTTLFPTPDVGTCVYRHSVVLNLYH